MQKLVNLRKKKKFFEGLKKSEVNLTFEKMENSFIEINKASNFFLGDVSVEIENIVYVPITTNSSTISFLSLNKKTNKTEIIQNKTFNPKTRREMGIGLIFVKIFQFLN